MLKIGDFFCLSLVFTRISVPSLKNFVQRLIYKCTKYPLPRKQFLRVFFYTVQSPLWKKVDAHVCQKLQTWVSFRTCSNNASQRPATTFEGRCSGGISGPAHPLLPIFQTRSGGSSRDDRSGKVNLRCRHRDHGFCSLSRYES